MVGDLHLQMIFFATCGWRDHCAPSTWLVEEDLLLPCGCRLGMRGWCKALWTRASLEAVQAFLRAVSNRVEGKIAVEVGNGECRSKDNSSVGTVDLTSARRESSHESIRLAKAGTVWLPMNARVFDPEERSLSKWAWVEGWSALRNPETVRATTPSRTHLLRGLIELSLSRRAPCEEG